MGRDGRGSGLRPSSACGAASAGSGSAASSAMTDVLRAITEMQTAFSGFTSRLEALEKKKSNCFNCGQPGHGLKEKNKKLHAKLTAGQ